MLYAVLVWSATAAGMIVSALLMLAFGRRTLPVLLAMGGAAKLLPDKSIRIRAGY